MNTLMEFAKMEFTWLIYIHFMPSTFSLMIIFLINKKILFNFIENYCFLYFKVTLHDSQFKKISFFF